MRLIGNILWFVLAGLWLAIGYLAAALVMFILIITIPFALQAVKLAAFALWPFGRTVLKRPDAGAPSVIGNILNLTSLISVYLNAAVQGFVIITVAFLQKGRR